MKQPDLRIWGKANDKTGTFHPALFHMLDSGFVAKAVLATLSEVELAFIGKALNLSCEELFEVLPFFVAHHDLGKITPKFVCEKSRMKPVVFEKVRELVKKLSAEGYSFNVSEEHIRHEAHSLYLAKKLLPDFPERSTIAALLGGHHGRYSCTFKDAILEKCFVTDGGFQNDKWQEQQLLAAQVLAAAFPIHIESLNKIHISEEIYFFLSGFISLSDWIASDDSLFPFVDAISWEEYVKYLPEKAEKALETIHLKPNAMTDTSFSEMFFFDPHASQSVLMESVSGLKEPSLIIMEDSTGHGKTEAALYAASRLMIQAGHRGIQVMMPTQATANAMLPRLEQYLKNTVGRANLQLAHGSAWANENYSRLRHNVSDEDAPIAEDWFTAGNKKMFAQFGDSTVDQGLLGILTTKYFYLKLFGLFNKVVILDEVHAYDAYVDELLVRLIEELKKLRCSIIVLSATLPKNVKDKLVAAYGCELKKDCQYPRIAVFSGRGKTIKQLPVDAVRTIELDHVYISPPNQPTLGQVIQSNEAAADYMREKGESAQACTGIFCNVVRQSQKMYAALKGSDRLLFHSHFRAEDRQRIENEILIRYGRNGIRPKGSFLVGTQAMEQSLNIDFDIAASFICPVDFLIQRMGRLWRFDLPRPVPTAQMTIFYNFKNTKAAQLDNYYVYEMFLMNLTWKTIQDRNKITTPDDVEKLINAVYNADPQTLDKNDRQYRRDFLLRQQGQQQNARNFLVSRDAGRMIRPLQPYVLLSGAACPQTRDIRLAMKAVLAFKKNGLWYSDPARQRRLQIKSEYSYAEIREMELSLCPIAGEPCFSYLQKSKPGVWDDIRELRHYGLIVFDDYNHASIAGKDLTYSSDMGLKID